VSDSPRQPSEDELTQRGYLSGVPTSPTTATGDHGPLDTTLVGVGTVASPRSGPVVGDLGPGSRLKHYEIIRELGRGGMARVVVARDLKLGRRVALKFLDTDSPDFTARFLVEARATARCSHENIVVIHEVDEHEGRPYMALELLEGQPLASFLAAGMVSPRRAVEIMVPVVSALVHAHALDIVHRDLKPENIFITSSGVIKVLDFGIAKLFSRTEVTSPGYDMGALSVTGPVLSGCIGTLPYMAPEQWGPHDVDHRVDLWAVGIIFWQLLAGRHPLDPLTREKLFVMAGTPEDPMPSIASAVPSLPTELERIVDRCLAKRRWERHATARELLDGLLNLVPGHHRRVSDQESPFLGLRPFQESDADRFFGRSRDVTHFTERIRDIPLVGVIGPSGVGKSSFVQAGIVPALRGSGDDWEVLVVRPGRDPLASLASLVEPFSSMEAAPPLGSRLPQRLRDEPGYLGVALRRRARQKGAYVLLFVDQFEELYALVGDPGLRQAFTACLAGAADDWSSPLRVVISMRSDFVDRVAEDRAFMDQLARGLVFLPPPDRDGLREALLHPLDAVGFRFEDPAIVEEIIDSLLGTPGGLPLLQFAATKLWEARDRERRLITRASYEAIGGIAGALAGHADQVLAGMPAQTRSITRAIFQRLVTADGTRATAQVAELAGLSADPRHVEAAIDLLVGARLLVVQSRGDDAEPAVEIVHESLIQSWPTLRRWLEESHEDGAFLEDVRVAARQWDAKGRASWSLWTGEQSDQARVFWQRYKGELGRLEHDYLVAVVQRATRAARRRRGFLVAAFTLLLSLVAAAGIALVRIQKAEKVAREQRIYAEDQAQRARAVQDELARQLALVKEKERARVAEEKARQSAERDRESALDAATRAQGQVVAGKEQLAVRNQQLKAALERANRATERANALAKDERAAKENLAVLYAKERERVRKLEEQKRKISTELKE